MAAIEISPSEERDTIQRMRSMMDKPRRLGDLTDEQIASMLFVIEDWERRGINGELTKKFRDILRRYGEKREALILATKRNIENEKARGEAERREAEKARQVKPKKSQPSEKPQEAPAKPETSAPLTVDRINKQTKSITKIIEDNDISKAELDSINYEEIKKIFRQSLNDTEESGEIVKSIAELDEVLAKLLELYRTRRKDSSFEPHEKYEGFLKDIGRLTVDTINMNIHEFIDLINKKGLDEVLGIYKKLEETREGGEDFKKMTITGILIDKYVLKKNYHIVYGEGGKVEIITGEWDDSSKSYKKASVIDGDVRKIESTISQNDLKNYVLKDVIKSGGFDFEKQTTDYEKIINKLLLKYEIKDNGGALIFSDITRFKGDHTKSPVYTAIKEKLKNPKSLEEYRDLNFILDYIIKGESSYPPKMIASASTLGVIQEAGFKVEKIKGWEGLMNAFKKGNGIKTLLNDVMSANGGMVGLGLIGLTIFGLFAGGKWRKFSFVFLGTLIFGPGAEELLHKYGLGDVLNSGDDKAEGGKGGDGASSERLNSFGGVDININYLPKEFKTKYESMYKDNFMERDDGKRIDNQDFAQIFAQLAGSAKFAEMDVQDIKEQIKDGKPTRDILGENLPERYTPGILKSKKNDDIIEQRDIPEDEVTKFLKLLVTNVEAGDTKVGDLFVEGQKTATKYLPEGYSGDGEIDSVINSLPIGALRDELYKIAKPDSNFWEKLFANKTDLIPKIGEIIGKLELLKAKYPANSGEIEKLVKLYENLMKIVVKEHEVDNLIEKVTGETDIRLWGVMDKIKGWVNEGVGTLWSIKAILGIEDFVLPNKLEIVSTEEIKGSEGEINIQIDFLEENSLKLPEEVKNRLIKDLKDVLLVLKNTRLSKLEGEGLDTSEVFAEILNLNSEKFLADFEGMKPSLDGLKNPQTSFKDYASVLAGNYNNLYLLKRIVSINGELLSEEGRKVKEKAEELLKYFTENYISNLQKYKKDFDKEVEDIKGKIDGVNVYGSEELQGIQKEIDELKGEALSSVAGLFNVVAEKLRITPINDNYVQGLEDYIKKLEITGTSFELNLAEEVKSSLEELERNLESKKGKLETDFELGIEGLPDDFVGLTANSNGKLNVFIDQVNKAKETVNGFGDEMKQVKINKIKQEVKKLVGLFIKELTSKITKDDDGNITGIDEEGIANVKALYDGRVKEELGDLLDNDFGNKYDEVMKKVAEYKFNERLGKIKLTSLSDDMKKIIEDKWDIKEEEETVKTVLDYFIGELNALDDFLKENPDDPEKIAQKADIEKYIKDIINGIKKDDSFKDYVNYLGHIALSNIKDWFK